MPRYLLTVAIAIVCSMASAQDPWVVYPGGDGPGAGKRIVLVSGDDEYRSEESLPQLGKILSTHHGFHCTVLFAINPETGEIQPDHQTNIPGLEKLEDADLMILFIRFRNLPDEQTAHIFNFIDAGKPVIALRTSTHPFQYPESSTSKYKQWTWNSKDPEGGYGRVVFGETWVNHHGKHQEESTRGVIADGMDEHPLVRGVSDVWGPSDVYGIRSLTGDSVPVLMGQVLRGMTPEDEPNPNKEMMPVIWHKTYTGDAGNTSRIVTSTMGHSGDFENEGFRRIMVNSVFWLLDMEVPGAANVDIVGEYAPTEIGFGKYKEGVTPSEHALD